MKEPSELFSIRGKVALVTGASRGLGLALSRGFAQAGAHVGMIARREQPLLEAADEVDSQGEGRTHAVSGDIRSESDIDRFVSSCASTLGPPDILVANAAHINRPREAGWELSKATWDQTIDITLTGTFLTCRRALQEMIPRRTGRVVCIASTSSLLASRGHAPYAAAKTGLMGLIRTLALEAAPHGVQVNAIGPAYIRTEMTAPSLEDPERHKEILAELPMGRVLEPEDLIGACLFLASSASSLITGQLLLVDAGLTLR